jgi:hypothetical protein
MYTIRIRLPFAKPSYSKTTAPMARTVPFHTLPLLITPSHVTTSEKATAPRTIAILRMSMSALLPQSARLSPVWATARKVTHALIDMHLMSALNSRTKALVKLERLVA